MLCDIVFVIMIFNVHIHPSYFKVLAIPDSGATEGWVVKFCPLVFYKIQFTFVILQGNDSAYVTRGDHTRRWQNVGSS